MPLAISGISLGHQAGIQLGKKASISGGDPLAGIPLALRLQTHSGFGATPNATTGLYQLYFAGAKFLMPTLNPAVLAEFSMSIDGGVETGVFSFAAADPADGSVYCGVATGNPVTDAASLSTAVNIALTIANASSDGSVNVTIISITPGDPSSVSVTGAVTAVNNHPDVTGCPAANADGDLVAARVDAIGNTTVIAYQSDPAKQGTLRIIGGIPKIEYNGTSDFYTYNYSLPSGPSTIITVMSRTTGGGSPGCIAACAPSTPLTNAIQARSAGSPNWGTYLNGDVNSSFSIDNQMTIMVSRVNSDGTSVDLITNGTVETKVGGGFYGGDGIDRRVIGSGSTGSNFLSGNEIASFIADYEISNADLNKIGAYCQTLSGVIWTPIP